MTEQQNPLLVDWTAPFEIPPFDRIEHRHFEPAFDQALAQNKQEVQEIADNPDPATFENTIDRLESSGKFLRKVSSVFFNLCGTDTNEDLQKIESRISPILARHYSEIGLNPKLFERIDRLFESQSDLNLSPEQRRVLERYHTDFVRSGAKLGFSDKDRMTEINARLASLSTSFTQNVLADEKGFQLVLESENDLRGLPEFAREAAATTAVENGLNGKHVITLARSSIEPFLQFSERRDLREQAFQAWVDRGVGDGETNNLDNIKEILDLRLELANLLGYRNYADFKLDDSMAKSSTAVSDLLNAVWEPAKQTAAVERDKLQDLIETSGENFKVEPWDWRYYAEKVRSTEFDISETEIKPYFQLEKMIDAAFHTAQRLFGLEFKKVEDLKLYHPDVRAWEVTDSEGAHVGLFLGDYFARPSKRSGAWMSGFRTQENLNGPVRPIIINVMNFVKGGEGMPSLLSFDDARTLFHEFGHALHGLLSDVTYPRIAGTRVARDFVELPSQLFEHWLSQSEILKSYAVHYQTGEPISDALVDRILRARNFNQGFATVEYLASAIVDLEIHKRDSRVDSEVLEIENECLQNIDMPKEISMRHRLSHFSHLFSGPGYASGYYSYMWSEVMDADAFAAFEESGDIFDPEIASRLKNHIYSSGSSEPPDLAYKHFRGRLPEIEPLLEKRGFLDS